MVEVCYAVIDSTNTVVNTVIWSGETNWTPPNCTSEGTPCSLIKITGACAIGWIYQNGKFIDPNEPSLEKALSTGYLDQTTGITLRCDDSARAKFTSQMVLINTAIAAGVIQNTELVTIWDLDDNPHQLSYPDYIGLILRYGMYISYQESLF